MLSNTTWISQGLLCPLGGYWLNLYLRGIWIYCGIMGTLLAAKVDKWSQPSETQCGSKSHFFWACFGFRFLLKINSSQRGDGAIQLRFNVDPAFYSLVRFRIPYPATQANLCQNQIEFWCAQSLWKQTLVF